MIAERGSRLRHRVHYPDSPRWRELIFSDAAEPDRRRVPLVGVEDATGPIRPEAIAS